MINVFKRILNNSLIMMNYNDSNKIKCKKDFLMDSLIIFYNKEKNLNYLKPIINGESKISLRLMDWFVTNYSKKHNICYLTEKNSKNINFIVYLDYKNQLKAYSKKQFDPFCRRERISFNDIKNNEIITTVGQLNFFKWAIENKIIEYIYNNFEDIENDMVVTLRDLYNKKNRNTNERKKRHELSINATKTINKHNVKITVEFD